jgi:hypothetical protein
LNEVENSNGRVGGDAVADGRRRPELDEADQLVMQGRRLDAIDLLTAANRRERDPAIETRLVSMRFHAAAQVDASSGRTPWPPSYPDPFPDVSGQPPEVDADRLDSALMGGAILHHGSVVVRRLLDADTVARLVADTQAALDAMERWKTSWQNHEDGEDGRDLDAADGSAYFHPFNPGVESNLAVQRNFVSDHNCVLINDSPPAMFDLIDAVRATGVLTYVEEYLGERPLLSMQKSTLRLSKPTRLLAGWHQDGAFIGEGARAINIWMPLSDCGGAARVPGLDLIPRRIEEIFEPTPPPALNQIEADTVLALASETPPVRPEFRAGDALVFDERLVHCTGRDAEMTGNRYGIEFWLFAPSTFPEGYLPMVV